MQPSPVSADPATRARGDKSNRWVEGHPEVIVETDRKSRGRRDDEQRTAHVMVAGQKKMYKSESNWTGRKLGSVPTRSRCIN